MSSNFQEVFNFSKSLLYAGLEKLTPVLKDSKFHETGVLTPEEFVAAGDFLVYQCPSWQWAHGDEASVKDYLPRDKQFLMTRNVPCFKRCRQMEYAADQELILHESDDEEGPDGGWVDTHHFAEDGSKAAGDAIGEMTLDDAAAASGSAEKAGSSVAIAAAAAAAGAAGAAAEDDDDECGDMEEMMSELENAAEDEEDAATLDVAAAAAAAAATTSTIADKTAAAAVGSEIVTPRTYDLNITYDKYYQTPRLWLYGYDETRKALSVDEMYEDFSADHANKTITMEAHPHLPGPPLASVHPCRHAQVMKKLIDQIMEGGGELGVHMYLIVFLKFVQAIIPTIEYDFTQNFALNSH